MVGPNEVLIHVEWAGVGKWDPFEREGGFARVYPYDVPRRFWMPGPITGNRIPELSFHFSEVRLNTGFRSGSFRAGSFPAP